MPVALRHNQFLYSFFKCYSLQAIKRNFHEVVIQSDIEQNSSAILIISNHISWWDGFWINYLNMKIFKRKFHFLMREDQLQKHWQFKYTGGISVKKNSKSLIESLNYAKYILNNSENMLLIFPEGAIHSTYKTHFKFEKGVERILDGNTKVQLVFAVNLVEFLKNKKPTLFSYLTEYKQESTEIETIEEAYKTFYMKSINQQSSYKI